ncbi:hypothetical protein M758_3G099400 [Ceratodon purpureus]|nr:hypothetical protein M758_3G099400 [Ceratodon purpureus]
MNDSEAGTSASATEDFDVFLNHRGPDVKATFVAHLEDALRCAGFRPFLDARSLMKGNPALKSIDQALDMAKVHVAVVSKRYAESKYCLNELVAMMRTGKPVIPVFYDVEPMDLRWVENGPFAEAFEKHKTRGRTEKKMQEWRESLKALAELTGFRLADYKSDEAKLKREVVNEVARLTPSNQPVEVDQYRVGLEGPISKCIQALENMGDEVGLLGLVGLGGVGKTILAREIYNHYVAANRFRRMTFLEIRRELSTSDVQIRPAPFGSLREQLLWDLLRVQGMSSNYDTWFRKVSTLGPVFIVIDDVHNLGQFQGLITSFGVLYPGSRIIVTSRDRSILNNFAGGTNGHYVYDVHEMDSHFANMLFNLHAFHSTEAREDYKDLAEDVVEACGGLPLALKVIGSSLFDKRLDEDRVTIWPEAIDALKQSTDVMGVLRWSYDNLTELEKLMFMDITCLFYDDRVENAFAYWESCKSSTSSYGGLCTPHTSLRNLINKNLLVMHSKTFCVHDLLRDLGQKIAMNARRHFVDDGFIEYQEKVETIGLNLIGCRKRKFNVENFANMSNLHFLGLPDGCKVNGDFESMPKKLRVFRWRRMPLAYIPNGLSLHHLTSIDFSKSNNLASIWTESNSTSKSFPNLRSLNLSCCTSITKLPNSLGQSLQLQFLNLSQCEKLKKLPNFIGQLKALKSLNLGYCSGLKTLPDTLTCPILEDFRLRGCTSITKLPDFQGQFPQLRFLSLDDCIKLKTLPTSIGQLKALTDMSLDGCTSIETLPRTVGDLSNLEYLTVSGCTSLVKIPTSIGLLSSLHYLCIGPKTEWLKFSDDKIGEAWTQLHLESGISGGLGSLLEYGALKSLKTLELFDSIPTELPESIGLLTNLVKLNMENCESLQCLPESIGLLTSLTTLNMTNCKSLQCLPKSIGDLKLLCRLELTRCYNLKILPKTLGALTSLKYLILEDCREITKLPKSIGLLSQLRYLRLVRCKNLQKLPASIRQLKSLDDVEITGCRSIEAMGLLTTLQGLPLWGSTAITKLPAALATVSDLGIRRRVIEHALRLKGGDLGCGSWSIHSGGRMCWQVLDEDESGSLRAYGDGQNGVRSFLLRVSE